MAIRKWALLIFTIKLLVAKAVPALSLPWLRRERPVRPKRVHRANGTMEEAAGTSSNPSGNIQQHKQSPTHYSPCAVRLFIPVLSACSKLRPSLLREPGPDRGSGRAAAASLPGERYPGTCEGPRKAGALRRPHRPQAANGEGKTGVKRRVRRSRGGSAQAFLRDRLGARKGTRSLP